MLDLYVLKTCPYCKKVRDFLDENGIEYRIFDIEEREKLNELLLIGGKEQVPYLYDAKNKIGLYESDTIINYVKTRCN